MEDWDGQVTTAQPVSSFGFDSKSQIQLPGLETLTNMKELTIKQLRPGCLERRSFVLIKRNLFIYSLSNH